MRIRFDDPTPDSYNSVLKGLTDFTVRLDYKDDHAKFYPTGAVVIRSFNSERDVVDRDGDLFVVESDDDGVPLDHIYYTFVPMDFVRTITVL